MYPRFIAPLHSRSQDGIALVMVLAFIVLLTILIVSFIAFTRLNRVSTTSYSKAIQAEEIAQGGLQDILGDLHNEILAGSAVYATNSSGGAYTNSYAAAYIPTTNLTAVPARIGYPNTDYGTDATPTALSPTLIRVSRATGNPAAAGGDTFFSAPPSSYNMTNVPGGAILNRASLVSTTNAYSGGRYISAARWNKSYLLATNAAFVPSPFTNAPPDWVYVTRTGSRVCTAAEVTAGLLKPSATLTANYGPVTPGVNPPASPVVGRYAFVMYDESALLDANVAGSPTALMNNSIAATPLPTFTNAPTATPPIPTSLAFTGKSYLSFADLMQLPGFSGVTGAQAAIDSFVTWRNAGGIANANATYGNTFLGAVFNYAQNGFLDFATGDSPLLSRQDLINYFSSIDPNINTTSATFSKALPYLGTFSRAVSAPSWTPTLDSQNIPGYIAITTPTPGLSTTAPVAYKTNAEKTGSINRDMANVRFATAGTVTHYYDNLAAATPSATYTVNVGDPLLQNRFSLAKINWLSSHALGGADPGAGANPVTGAAPSANYATAIQACFGLTWGSPGGSTATTANGGNPCWNYVGSPAGSGGTLAAFNGTIETLDQVALESREPNFFELLKAAILSGSTGLGPGLAAFQNGAANGADSRNAPYDVKNPPGYNFADLVGAGGLFSYTFGSAGTAAAVPARIPDIQIIQIGANIIDQYDTDSYPTAIYFPYQLPGGGSNPNDPVSGSLANAIYGPVSMVYGDENLPLLSKMIFDICSPNPSGTNDASGTGPAGANSPDDNTHSLEGWLQPEIWNPHQQPTASLGTNVPHNFEIRAYGNAMTYAAEQGGTLASDMTVAPNGWIGGLTAPASPNNWSLSNSPIQSYYTGTSSTEKPTDGQNEKAGTITFTDTSTTSSFYATPRLLTQVDADGITGLSSVTSPLSGGSSTSTPGTTAGNVALSNFPYYAISSGGYYNHFVGFTAGLIADNAGGPPPYQPYYVGTTFTGTQPVFAGAQTGVSFPVTGNTPTGGVSFALGWVDGSNNFHPYSFITGAFTQAYMAFYDDAGHPPDGRLGSAVPGYTEEGGVNWGLPDPRTGRFVLMSGSFVSGEAGVNSTLFPLNNANAVASTGGIPTVGNFTSPQQNGYVGNITCYPEDWMINATSVTTNQRTGADPRLTVTPSSPTYYADPDGVVRPGDGLYSNINTGDGTMLFTSAGTGGTAVGDTTATGNGTGNTEHGRRPVILNRPFRSVGELGYVFRDMPFKTLDFFSASSADAALLDVFSLTDESKVSSNSQLGSVVAGQFNPNNAPLPVIEAVLSGGSKKDLDPTYNLGAESTSSPTVLTNLATAIAGNLNPTTGPNPILNRAGLVTQIVSGLQYTKITTGPAPFHIITRTSVTPYNNTADEGNKAYLEAPVRALADVTNTRTWNLMVDIIAQSGYMSPTAKTLNDFVVEGEKRYWLHIAIDRYTGKIVDQHLEPVYE